MIAVNTTFVFSSSDISVSGNTKSTLVRKMAESNPPDIQPAPMHFKSKVWTHFGFYKLQGKVELDMSKTVCRLCHGQLSYCGNTTNMTAHIARHHPEKKIELDQAKRRPLATVQQTLDSTLHKLPAGSEKAQRITTSIAHFICKDLRPYSVVENTGFRNMIHTLDPRYIIPSRKYFSQTAIPEIYREVMAEVKQKLRRAERIALTSDAWTSRATASYVTFTAHYIAEDWALSSHVLQTKVMYESHTGANIAELLNNVTTEYCICIVFVS